MNTDRWNAGIELMKSTDPTGWEVIATEMKLAESNHEAITKCRGAAAKLKKPQSCEILVAAP